MFIDSNKIVAVGDSDIYFFETLSGKGDRLTAQHLGVLLQRTTVSCFDPLSFILDNYIVVFSLDCIILLDYQEQHLPEIVDVVLIDSEVWMAPLQITFREILKVGTPHHRSCSSLRDYYWVNPPQICAAFE